MLGATVDWNNETQTVVSTKGNTTIEMTLGKSEFYKNGEAIQLDVPAKALNGRTLVPVRAVAESFNCDVYWDDSRKTVVISD